MQERPQVTITNPAEPRRPAEVLDADDPAPGSPKRLVVAVVVVLALLAVVSGVDELRQRRAADAQERRLQAVVQVELTDRFGMYQSADYDGAAQQAVLSRGLGIRNSGPRAVVVESAVVDGLRLLGGPVEVAPGEEERLLVQQRLPCSPAPASTRTSLSVQLGVRTGAGVTEQELILGQEMTASGEDARRACGLVSAGEAVQVFSQPGGRVLDGVLEVPLGIGNYGARTTRVLEVRGGAGLSAELLDDLGRPVALPLELEPRPPGGGALERAFGLRLRVTDCSLVDASDAQSFQPDSAFTISYLPADDAQPEGSGAVTTSLFDPAPVHELLVASCPGPTAERATQPPGAPTVELWTPR